jgi:hypothetical protein
MKTLPILVCYSLCFWAAWQWRPDMEAAWIEDSPAGQTPMGGLSGTG